MLLFVKHYFKEEGKYTKEIFVEGRQVSEGVINIKEIEQVLTGTPPHYKAYDKVIFEKDFDINSMEEKLIHFYLNKEPEERLEAYQYAYDKLKKPLKEQ